MKYAFYLIIGALSLNSFGDEDSFNHSFAAGEKFFSFQDAPMTITVENKEQNLSPRTWQTTCATRAPISLKGAYPSVEFRSGVLRCATQQQPLIAGRLPFFLQFLAYDLFGADLLNLDASRLVRSRNWQSARSEYSAIKEDRVILDERVVEYGALGLENTIYYLRLELTQDRLLLDFTMDTRRTGERAVLKLEANLH